MRSNGRRPGEQAGAGREVRVERTGQAPSQLAPNGCTRRGFTLTEMLFSIAVVILLMGMLIGGLRLASRVSNRAVETQAVASLILACEEFKNDFGFAPPLIQDNFNNETKLPDQ